MGALKEFREALRDELLESGQCTRELLDYLIETVELEVERRMAHYGDDVSERLEELARQIRELEHNLNRGC